MTIFKMMAVETFYEAEREYCSTSLGMRTATCIGSPFLIVSPRALRADVSKV
jgi:hypothetical protein